MYAQDFKITTKIIIMYLWKAKKNFDSIAFFFVFLPVTEIFTWNLMNRLRKISV